MPATLLLFHLTRGVTLKIIHTLSALYSGRCIRIQYFEINLYRVRSYVCSCFWPRRSLNDKHRVPDKLCNMFEWSRVYMEMKKVFLSPQTFFTWEGFCALRPLNALLVFIYHTWPTIPVIDVQHSVMNHIICNCHSCVIFPLFYFYITCLCHTRRLL